MESYNPNWVQKEQDEDHVASLSKEAGILPITARILLNRGIASPDEAKKFLEIDTSAYHDPFCLDQMETACDRIKQAISTKEKILIYGDYDVDGMAGTALLVKALRKLGGSPDYWIPNRLQEGYGLNKARVQRAKEEGYSLLITLDNGTTATEEISEAVRLGLDVIVVDHHVPEGQLPPAMAILNPHLPGSAYPFKDLCAAGVVFKLCEALVGTREGVELAALATVADIVPLLDENRTIVQEGLDVMNQGLSPGIASLVEVSGLNNRELTTGHISFLIAPRLNAAGRLGDSTQVVELLLSDDFVMTHDIAQDLHRQNQTRQKIEGQILEQALEKEGSEFESSDRVIVLADDRWHPGVVGIVASRLVEKYYRPTVLIALEDGQGRGSGRSIRSFELHKALTECRDDLLAFGGHRYAAGLSIQANKVASLRRHLNDIAERWLEPQDLVPTVRIDEEVSFAETTPKLLDELQRLAPFGFGNPQPLFSTPGLRIVGKPQLVANRHLRFAAKHGGIGRSFIAFRRAEWLPPLSRCSRIDAAYTLERRFTRGDVEIQMILKSWKPSED